MSLQITSLGNTEFHASCIQKCIESAVHNTLRTNVHPASGSHLPVIGNTHLHGDMPVFLVIVKAYHHGVRNNNARRFGLGTEQAQRVSALDNECLVLRQHFEILLDKTVLHPVLAYLSRLTVCDKLVRIEGNIKTKIIVNHYLECFAFDAIPLIRIDRFCLKVALWTVSVAIDAPACAKLFHELRGKGFM